jgi:hypothetical protein
MSSVTSVEALSKRYEPTVAAALPALLVIEFWAGAIDDPGGRGDLLCRDAGPLRAGGPPVANHSAAVRHEGGRICQRFASSNGRRWAFPLDDRGRARNSVQDGRSNLTWRTTPFG